MKFDEQLIDSIEINPESAATHSIIWLHGLGADGSDFASIVPELRLPSKLAVRFVFPHAPIMPVSINNGYKMRAWFDIFDLAIVAKIDEVGISKSTHMLEALIRREEALGIQTDHIILAGFSQGAVIALTLGITLQKKLGGVIALSGYLPLADNVLTHASTENKTTPIFIGHGTADPMVPFALGQATYQALKIADYPVELHSYPMPHSVCGEEIGDISKWIQERWV